MVNCAINQPFKLKGAFTDMVEKQIIVENESGLHARPAASLVNYVRNYKGSVEIFENGKTANLKSIISIMSMGLRKGSEVTLRIDGEDEVKFIEELAEFIAKLEG